MQRFAIDFEYPVCFTSNLFTPSHPLLAEILTRKESGRRHRCVVPAIARELQWVRQPLTM